MSNYYNDNGNENNLFVARKQSMIIKGKTRSVPRRSRWDS